MTETYSQAVTGRRADSQFTPTVVQVGDTGGGTPGLQQSSMATGLQILCKNRDGSQSWYTIDAERSIPGTLVMKAV